ncbi:MAG TPA: hypothetical protein VFT29_11500 [Gemmatimonadaceae bacterium]|nr:hypothetical protein [Gemmatimonadaceae bacterium]
MLSTVLACAVGAQTPAADPSARLREVLPADVADRVLARIAEARSHELPAAALENRALKFAAKGVPAKDIEDSVNEQAVRMEKAKAALENGRGKKANGDEIDAGAEALRKGVDGAQVSSLAKSAPSGRSLAVPLFVVGSLMDRGLPSDEALKRVQEKLQSRASDRDLEDLPGAVGRANKPAVTGQDMAATKRPADAGTPTASGRPANVPANAGKPATPGAQGRTKKP